MRVPVTENRLPEIVVGCGDTPVDHGTAATGSPGTDHPPVGMAIGLDVSPPREESRPGGTDAALIGCAETRGQGFVFQLLWGIVPSEGIPRVVIVPPSLDVDSRHEERAGDRSPADGREQRVMRAERSETGMRSRPGWATGELPRTDHGLSLGNPETGIQQVEPFFIENFPLALLAFVPGGFKSELRITSSIGEFLPTETAGILTVAGLERLPVITAGTRDFAAAVVSGQSRGLDPAAAFVAGSGTVDDLGPQETLGPFVHQFVEIGLVRLLFGHLVDFVFHDHEGGIVGG